MGMSIIMTNMNDNIGVSTVSNFNPCKEFALFKKYLIKTFLGHRDLFFKNDAGFLLHISKERIAGF